jgi:hypothetical protein
MEAQFSLTVKKEKRKEKKRNVKTYNQQCKKNPPHPSWLFWDQ